MCIYIYIHAYISISLSLYIYIYIYITKVVKSGVLDVVVGRDDGNLEAGRYIFEYPTHQLTN